MRENKQMLFVQCQRQLRLGVGILFLVILMVGMTGCKPEPETEEVVEIPRNVRTLQLQTSSLEEYFEVAGPVRPVRGTDIHAEESGTVGVIANDKGQQIQAGAVLIELDRSLLAAELAAGRANFEWQQYNVEKTQQLFDAGKISRIELLGAKAEFARAKSVFEVADVRYGRAAIKAPYAGLVVDRFVELGELVNPGQRVARLIDPYTLKLEAYLTETEVGWVSEGSPAEVTLQGSEQIASGRLHWVGFEAEPLSGKFQVEIYIDNRDLQYHSGMIGRAKLKKSDLAEMIVIPRDALLTRNIGTSVFVVRQDSRAYLQKVTLGPDQGLMVLVVDGLNVGDRIVVRGQRDLKDGNLVDVTEVADAADGSARTDPEVVKSVSAGSRVGQTGQEANK